MRVGSMCMGKSDMQSSVVLIDQSMPENYYEKGDSQSKKRRV